MLSLINNYALVERHRWFTVPPNEETFDLDKIVQAALSDFEIDSLFSKIIQILENLAKSGELDSIRASIDLNRIIWMLQSAESSSFVSKVMTWSFARRFVPNLLVLYAKKSPILGPVIEAFEQTSKELDVGLDAAKDRIGEQFLKYANSGFRSDALARMSAYDNKALSNLLFDDKKVQ